MNEEDPNRWSGVRTGMLCAGEWVTITDTKGHRKSIKLVAGKVHHTTKGGLAHDDIIGQPEGIVVTTVGGLQFLVFRPLLNEYMVTMPRQAAVIYPKDAAQIIMRADIFPGARVLEAGVGSGALSLAMLRTIGPSGLLHSVERRAEFAEVARRNVEQFCGGTHPGWELSIGDLAEITLEDQYDRAVLDMLAPWDCLEKVSQALVAGGLLCCYVATTTQMGRVMDSMRAMGCFTEPMASEVSVRDWHAEGLAIRPGHATSAHTGFLVITRRMAPGVDAPMRKRRPAPGAYGPDYTGPVPRNVAAEHMEANRRRAREMG